MTKKAHIDFFFDYSSPYAYLASTQIEKIAQEANATLSWKPMLLGAVFRAVGTKNVPMLEMPEAKQRSVRLDMYRYAKYYSVSFNFPKQFPIKTTLPLRATLAAMQKGQDYRALIHSIYRSYWVEGQDISSPEVIAGCLRQTACDPALIQADKDSEFKQALISRTNEALERGVFGAPTFVIDGEFLVWGQDRMPLLPWLCQRDESYAETDFALY